MYPWQDGTEQRSPDALCIASDSQSSRDASALHHCSPVLTPDRVGIAPFPVQNSVLYVKRRLFDSLEHMATNGTVLLIGTQ